MGDIFCPINSNESTRRLVPEQGKCLCDKEETCWHINEEEDGHDQVEDEQGSVCELLARPDVSILELSGQQKVDRCDNERDNCDSQ